MSEALPTDPAPEAAVDPAMDPDVAMLARLAAVGMAAVERVHGELMAAKDTAELNALSLTQSRLSRCVRQTLLLKSKLAREARQTATDAAVRQLLVPRQPAHDPVQWANGERANELEDALARIAHAVGHSSDKAIDTLNERIEVEIADWYERSDFAEADLDAQVRWLCGRLGYPADLADTWRALEHPDDREPPWGWPEAKAEHPAEPPAAHADDPPPLAPRHESSA
jgi:hypothetical protein